MIRALLLIALLVCSPAFSDETEYEMVEYQFVLLSRVEGGPAPSDLSSTRHNRSAER